MDGAASGGTHAGDSAALCRLLESRYSCRAYRPDPVPRAVVEQALGMAQRTPSWCNTQPWQIAIASGDALRRFAEAVYSLAAAGQPARPDFPFPAAYLGPYRERRKVCGVQLYQSLGIGRDDRAGAARQALENFRCFGAPHVALLTTPKELGIYGMLDCGLYLTSFMLALRSLGIDCIAQAALASYPDVVREHFGFAEDRAVVCGVSFGYGVPEAPVNGYRTERATAAEAVRWFG